MNPYFFLVAMCIVFSLIMLVQNMNERVSKVEKSNEEEIERVNKYRKEVMDLDHKLFELRVDTNQNFQDVRKSQEERVKKTEEDFSKRIDRTLVQIASGVKGKGRVEKVKAAPKKKAITYLQYEAITSACIDLLCAKNLIENRIRWTEKDESRNKRFIFDGCDLSTLSFLRILRDSIERIEFSLACLKVQRYVSIKSVRERMIQVEKMLGFETENWSSPMNLHSVDSLFMKTNHVIWNIIGRPIKEENPFDDVEEERPTTGSKKVPRKKKRRK